MRESFPVWDVSRGVQETRSFDLIGFRAAVVRVRRLLRELNRGVGGGQNSAELFFPSKRGLISAAEVLLPP